MLVGMLVFVTKVVILLHHRQVVLRHRQVECHVKRLGCCLQGQGHSEGSYNQNVTVSIVSFGLILLHPTLF